MATLPLDKPQTDTDRNGLTMTYEEFLAWSDEDTHAEWVPIDDMGNGEVTIQGTPRLVHQQPRDFLHQLLSFFINLFDLGEIGFAPFEVRLQYGSDPGRGATAPISSTWTTTASTCSLPPKMMSG